MGASESNERTRAGGPARRGGLRFAGVHRSAGCIFLRGASSGTASAPTRASARLRVRPRLPPAGPLAAAVVVVSWPPSSPLVARPSSPASLFCYSVSWVLWSFGARGRLVSYSPSHFLSHSLSLSHLPTLSRPQLRLACPCWRDHVVPSTRRLASPPLASARVSLRHSTGLDSCYDSR